MTSAVLYARFSTELQTERSIEDQFRVCREYAAARGWTVTAEFADRGISGAALGNRPGAQEAIKAAVDVLLVNDLSRLSRSQDLAPLLSRLRHRGVRVIGAQDGFDSDSRTARMQAGLSGIMSEEFRTMIADRVRSSHEMLAMAGESTGGKAYNDAQIIQEIFSRFADGETMRAIANDLNRRGVPSPGAAWKARASPRGRWVVSSLHSLLQNERYIGRVVWKRSQWVRDPDTGIRKRRERPASEWIVRECEPIVDADTWARVQARFTGGGGAGRGGRPSYMLSGLLTCALCGSKMIIIGGAKRRYGCGAHHAGGEHACANRSTFMLAAAEDALLEHVRERMLSSAAVEEAVRMLREERAAAERPAKEPDREIAELERLVREGVLSSEVAAPALAEARRRARARAQPGSLPWPTEALWRESVAGMLGILKGDDITASREVIRRMIGEPIPCRPEGAYVIATLGKRRVALTGTGSSVYGMVAGVGFELRIRAYTRPAYIE